MSGSSDIARAYALLGQKDKARKMYDELWKISLQYVNYYLSLNPRLFNMSQSECKKNFQIMMNLVNENEKIDNAWANKHATQLQNLFARFENRGGALM